MKKVLIAVIVAIVAAGCSTTGDRVETKLVAGIDNEKGVDREALFKIDGKPCFIVASTDGVSITGKKMTCQSDNGVVVTPVSYKAVHITEHSMAAGTSITFVAAK